MKLEIIKPKQKIDLNQLVSISENISEVELFLVSTYEQLIDGMYENENSLRKNLAHGKEFIDYVHAKGLHLNILSDYKKNLIKKYAGHSTIGGKFSIAKRLLLLLKEKYGLLKVDLTYGVKGIAQGTKQHKKKGLDWEQITKVEDYITALPYFETYYFKTKKGELKQRERTTHKDTKLMLFYLLAFQGLREFEVANIKIEGINLSDKTLTIRGKGRSDDEQIRLHSNVIVKLEQYLEKTGLKSGYLFPSRKIGNPISTRQIRMFFTHKENKTDEKRRAYDSSGNEIKINQGIFTVLGIENRSVHSFRYFFITELLRATGGDLLLVSHFSRHKSIETVKVYDKRDVDDEFIPAMEETFKR